MAELTPRGQQVSGSVRAGSGQYYLDPGVWREGDWPDSLDGLTMGDETRIAVSVGADHREIEVQLQAFASSPPLDESGWEMIVERDIVIDRRREHSDGNPIGGRPYQIAVLEGETGQFPLALPLVPGRYRVRISVTGRSAIEPLTERHQISVWPALGSRSASTLIGPDDQASRYGRQSLPPGPENDVEAAAQSAISELLDLANRADPPHLGPSEPTDVAVQKIVHGQADQIFALMHSPDTWLGWGGTPDLTVDGRFVLWLVNAMLPEPRLFVVGSVTEKNENQFISFTWTWSSGSYSLPSHPSTVTIELHDRTESVAVTVRHLDLPTELTKISRDLWVYYLDRLDTVTLEGSVFSPHPWTPA